MAQRFPVRLVTPTGTVFEGTAEQVTAWGTLGQFGVLANHTDFITPLVPGLLTITSTDNGTGERYVVAGGFAEVRGGAMVILATEAIVPAVEDEAALAHEAEAAERRLAQLSSYEPDFREAEQAARLVRARIQASELSRTAGTP